MNSPKTELASSQTEPEAEQIEPPSERSSLRTRIIVVALVVALVFGAIYFFSARDTESGAYTPLSTGQTSGGNVGLKVGDVAPDFVVTGLDGQQIRLSNLRGQPVWLNFWATWCPPCRAEMPDIENVYKQKSNNGLVVLAVSLGEDADTVRSFIQGNGYTFTIGLDPSQTVGNQYRVLGTPTHYFIDKNGIIKGVNVGALSRSAMLRKVEQILN